jgi:hypothetical protein
MVGLEKQGIPERELCNTGSFSVRKTQRHRRMKAKRRRELAKWKSPGIALDTGWIYFVWEPGKP